MVCTLKNVSRPINTLVKQLPLNTQGTLWGSILSQRHKFNMRYLVSEFEATSPSKCHTQGRALFSQGSTPAACRAVWAPAKLGYKSGLAVGREPSGGRSSEEGMWSQLDGIHHKQPGAEWTLCFPEWFENVRPPPNSAARVFGEVEGHSSEMGSPLENSRFTLACPPSHTPSTLSFVMICRKLCSAPFLPSGVRKPSVRVKMILDKGILGVKYLF